MISLSQILGNRFGLNSLGRSLTSEIPVAFKSSSVIDVSEQSPTMFSINADGLRLSFDTNDNSLTVAVDTKHLKDFSSGPFILKETIPADLSQRDGVELLISRNRPLIGQRNADHFISLLPKAFQASVI